MPIKTFCDICDNEITEKRGSYVQYWAIDMENQHEKEFNRETIAVDKGDGSYRGTVTISTNHQYVCKACASEIRRTIEKLANA